MRPPQRGGLNSSGQAHGGGLDNHDGPRSTARDESLASTSRGVQAVCAFPTNAYPAIADAETGRRLSSDAARFSRSRARGHKRPSYRHALIVLRCRRTLCAIDARRRLDSRHGPRGGRGATGENHLSISKRSSATVDRVIRVQHHLHHMPRTEAGRHRHRGKGWRWGERTALLDHGHVSERRLVVDESVCRCD